MSWRPGTLRRESTWIDLAAVHSGMQGMSCMRTCTQSSTLPSREAGCRARSDKCSQVSFLFKCHPPAFMEHSFSLVLTCSVTDPHKGSKRPAAASARGTDSGWQRHELAVRGRAPAHGRAADREDGPRERQRAAPRAAARRVGPQRVAGRQVVRGHVCARPRARFGVAACPGHMATHASGCRTRYQHRTGWQFAAQGSAQHACAACKELDALHAGASGGQRLGMRR